MAIPEANISKTGSLVEFLGLIKTAGVPERVTFEFLKTLGLKSSNDRPVIPVLKGIGFLDANGAPTELYRAYRTDRGSRVLAEALRNAYSDIFLANTRAHTLSVEKVKSIIAGKTTKPDATVERIARTFLSLAKAADFSAGLEETKDVHPQQEKEEVEAPQKQIPIKTPYFHYNIQIHLPTTTDITVYNAIFRSLRESLLV